MLTTDRVVVTEGRYDKSRLAGIIDAPIVTTDGFGVFRLRSTQELLRRLAREKGLIILTDSDAAGFRIRAFIKNICPPGTCADAFIPDVYGKESRKPHPGAEGKLGVEGVSDDLIRSALLALPFVTEEGRERETAEKTEPPLTAADLYTLGLVGREDSSLRRRELLARLGLPERLRGNTLLGALNSLYSRSEFYSIAETISKGE